MKSFQSKIRTLYQRRKNVLNKLFVYWEELRRYLLENNVIAVIILIRRDFLAIPTMTYMMLTNIEKRATNSTNCEAVNHPVYHRK